MPTAVKKAAKKRNPKGTPQKKDDGVLYPEIKTQMFVLENAIDVDKAMELLGWEAEAEEQFGNSYLLTDSEGKKIRCHNNTTNRQYYPSTSAALMQDILRGRWAGPSGSGSSVNGENLIIGRTGKLISAQHRLIALVLAHQEWGKEPDKYPLWTTPPVIDALVVFGIDETEEIAQTIDTARPQSLADVIYRSDYFGDMADSDRKKISRVCDYAVRQVWDRTGYENAFGIHRTHSESFGFIGRHLKIIECVTFIFNENVSNRITKVISPGYASGLLYLMGCAKSNGGEYHKSENPSEELLDWSLWDKAMEFWTIIDSTDFSSLPNAITRLINDEGVTVAERCALVIKAWGCFLEDKPITTASIKLKYDIDASAGTRELAECPTVGGIDLGTEQADPDPEPPTLEQIEHRSKVQRATKAAKKTRKKGKSAPDKYSIGEHVWVHDSDGDNWDGTLVETYNSPDGLIAQVKMATGETYDTPLDTLRDSEPTE